MVTFGEVTTNNDVILVPVIVQGSEVEPIILMDLLTVTGAVSEIEPFTSIVSPSEHDAITDDKLSFGPHVRVVPVNTSPFDSNLGITGLPG
jgi:hypothetical protein